MLSAWVSYVVYSETRGQPSGVDVILVEARAATTSFLREIAVRAQELLAGGPPELLQRHGPVLRGYTRRTHEQTGTDTNVMARAIGEALTAPRPRARYIVDPTDGDGPRRQDLFRVED
jgi:hypothetical protein